MAAPAEFNLFDVLLPGIGMSRAHLRARISGQASVDRVDS